MSEVQKDILAGAVTDRIRKEKARMPQVWEQKGRAVGRALLCGYVEKKLIPGFIGDSPGAQECA